MASRKRQPVFDTAAKTHGGVSNYPVPTVALNDGDFDTYVRMIKSATLVSALGIKATIDANMKRLRLRSKGTEPVTGVPAGSSQTDVGTLVAWAGQIKKADAAAKDQLVKLSATVNARVQ